MKIQTPLLTTDGIIVLYDDAEQVRGIVLIERKNPPYGLALPGGFVDVGESVEAALIREMKEETNLDVNIVALQNVYSEPSRDERFHTASVVYVCRAKGEPKAQDDAKAVFVVPFKELVQKEYAFDHGRIIYDFLKTIQYIK